jgi:mannosyltransferase
VSILLEITPRKAAGDAGRAFQYRPDWVLIAPPAVTLAVTLWGISAPSYWRDEAATLSAVSRSLPQLVLMLGHIDAVHGLYYLALWPLVKVAGTGELVTRFPSALAMAAADLGVAAIARELSSRRAALCAGLVFAALPMVSVQGHNARPYAMVTATAVLASYLLLRAVADPRPRWFTGYGLSLTLTGYLHLFALLLVPAHTITLMGLTTGRAAAPGGGQLRSSGEPRGRWRLLVARRWLVTVAAVGLAATPVGILGWLQRGQIAWIRKPGWHDVSTLATSLTLGSAASAALIGALAVLGAARGPGRRAGCSGTGLIWLAAPWLVLPPVMLLAVSQINPVYSLQYVTFCLPAVALLAGAGLAALSWPWRTTVLALIAALALPVQLAVRGPGSGGSLRAAAQVLAASERPGDAVIYPGPGAYPGPGIPADNLAYPDGFGQLRDIGLAESAARAEQLNGTSVPLAVLKQRECGVHRIWAVEMGPDWRNPAWYLTPGFRLVHQWRPDFGAMRLWLYQRARPCGGHTTSPRLAAPMAGRGSRGHNGDRDLVHGVHQDVLGAAPDRPGADGRIGWRCLGGGCL